MNKKVLIVDDSASMRSLVVSALEELSEVETVEAGNGYEALKILTQHRFNMMILDINMPEINGLDVLRFVKGHASYKNILTIIISTDHGEKNVSKGLALGADWYFVKPFEMGKFKETVEVLLN